MYSEEDALSDIIPFQMMGAFLLSILGVGYVMCTSMSSIPFYYTLCSRFFFIFSYVMACYTSIMVMVLGLDMLILPVLFSAIKMMNTSYVY